jgi:hypothetical protein
VNTLVHRLSRWFSSAEACALDRHLQAASNRADVERLLRQWDTRDNGAIRLP